MNTNFNEFTSHCRSYNWKKEKERGREGEKKKKEESE
jgi:hypothetical protein